VFLTLSALEIFFDVVDGALFSSGLIPFRQSTKRSLCEVELDPSHPRHVACDRVPMNGNSGSARE
jgi:hypothetical protein